jgi:hypothetical protein
MSRGGFWTLCLITLMTVVAAVAVQMARVSEDTIRLQGTRLFPDLEKRLNAVARVEIETPEARFTLARDGDGWMSPSADGYPVKRERANRLLVEVARLDLIAAKTARPELYSRLAVGDPTTPGARSRRMTLRDSEGRVMADLIVGKQRHARTGRRDRGTYVREPESARAFLAAGFIDLSDTVYPWLRSRLIDLDPERVSRVEITPRDGRRLLAVRPEQGAPAMGIAGLPSGARPNVAAIRELPEVLTGVRFDAVRSRADLALPPPLSEARITTFDGLRVSARVYRRMGEYWLTLSGDAAPEAAPGIQDEARDLAARTDGWAFAVADYLGERLSQSLGDILDTGS